MYNSNAINKTLLQLHTPCVIVMEDVVKNNCKKMIERAKQLNVDIRCHVKTHKTLEIGKFQTDGLDSKKIIVSTLAEAEFFSKEFFDILYAIPISPCKIAHAYQIHQRIDNLHLMIDHVDHIEHLVNLLKSIGGIFKPFSVFLKIDCGYHRAGANPNSQQTIDLVDMITKGNYSSYFNFQGIYTHSGHSYKCMNSKEIGEIAKVEAEVAGSFGKKLRSLGYPCKVVSIGSTPVCSNLPDNLAEYGVTEIHPGNYVFYDLMQIELGNCKQEDVGIFVLATVISIYPDRNEFLVDSGSLALSSDPGCTHLLGRATPCFGVVSDDINLRIVSATQEIGKISSTNGSAIDFSKYPIGSRLKIIPNHSCLTAANGNNFQIIKDLKSDSVTQTWIPNKFW